MAYIRNLLDDERISVWTTRQGKHTSDTAIISAHGETAYINGNFPRGAYTLVYFGPHGSTLVDPGLQKFFECGVVEVESYTFPNFGQDYELTKYQSKHNKMGETHDLIQSLVGGFPGISPDIITVSKETSTMGVIKRELLGEGIQLSTLITEVRGAGYNYTSFHCAFCRGINSIFFTDPVHTPQLK